MYLGAIYILSEFKCLEFNNRSSVRTHCPGKFLYIC